MFHFVSALTAHEPVPNTVTDASVTPEQLILLGAPEEHPMWTIVPIHLWPVQYDVQNRAFYYFPEMKFELQYGAVDESQLTPDNLKIVVDQDTASTLHRLISSRTLLTPPLLTIDWGLAGFRESIPMVIIADDYKWSSLQPSALSTTQVTTTRGDALSKDSAAGLTVTEHFQRLADWKIQRGINAQVFKISDIVKNNLSGKYDQYGPASAIYDLAEMIRRFITYAKDNWDTRFAGW